MQELKSHFEADKTGRVGWESSQHHGRDAFEQRGNALFGHQLSEHVFQTIGIGAFRSYTGTDVTVSIVIGTERIDTVV